MENIGVFLSMQKNFDHFSDRPNLLFDNQV